MPSKKAVPPSKKAVQAFLKTVGFDPRADSLLVSIASGLTPQYLQQRALEETSRMLHEVADGPAVLRSLRRIIQYLALSGVMIERKETNDGT